MKRPFNAYFSIPGGGKIQHRTMRVAPHSKVSVQLRMEPRLNYEENTVVFGFGGASNKRPRPISYLNEFMQVGAEREGIPGQTPGHSIDEKGRYQIRRTRACSKPNCYTLGFIVETRGPGKFPVELNIITNESGGAPRRSLEIIVTRN